ncbi:helix-turn-helix domain-containing protein [Paenibacillus sp. TRM 82003]|nr:helix-turn-helix domain-containing protein [Paenibacillus sp. TRM 82003]
MQASETMIRDDYIAGLLLNRWLAALVAKEDVSASLPAGLAMRSLNVSLAFPTLALLEPSGATRGRERRRLAEQIRNVVARLAPEGSTVFMDEEGRVGLLFSWVSKEALSTLQREVCGAFGVPVNLGVGLPCGKLADAHQSYRQAAASLGHTFYRGVGQVIYFNEIGEVRRLRGYPYAKERVLYERIRNGDDMENIEGAVDDFYEELLQEGPIERRSLDELTLRLLMGFEKRVFTATQDDSGSGDHYQGCDMMAILAMETLDEVKAYVCQQLRELFEATGGASHRESHSTVIKRTLEFMEREYEVATLQTTAQKVFMTPTYLSALFKTSTGKTFIELLTDIRIKHAKYMLKHTHLKNYEVAEKVGYKDSRYFSQIFKKKVGLSPSEYRELEAP